MTTEARIPQKVLWPTTLIAVVGLFLLAIWLEKLAASPLETDLLPTPAFSVPSGLYDHSFSLAIAAPSVPDAQIIYTTNGRSPLPESATVYNSPIPLDATEPNVSIIRARTLLPDGSLSDEVVGTYALGVETDLPLVSLVVEPDDLWSDERGILANPDRSGREWERVATITYLDENGRYGFSEPVGVRLHGQASRYANKKSLRLYFRRDYGLGRLNYPLFPGSDVTSFDRLVLHSGGQDIIEASANGTLMRTQLMSKLAQQIGAPTTYNKHVLLFLNGELYGVYFLRERPDEVFFQDHFGLENVDIIDSPQRELNHTEATADWLTLEAYAAEHDLADPEHYATVLAQIDVNSFIDHYLLQMYAADNDWPHNNERLFRGGDPLARWQWFLWDVDYSFGKMAHSNLDFDMVKWLMDPDEPDVVEATRFFRSLWANPDFRNRFLVRAADLLNTVLSPDNVAAQLEAVEAVIADDIGYEIARWGSPGNWYASAAQMETFAQQRTAIMFQHFVDGFDLAGTAVLTLNPPVGKGTIILNDTLSPNLPYTGSYFLDTTLTVTATPESGYQFAGWEVNGEMTDGETATSTRSGRAVLHHTLTQDTTITPHFARE